MTVNHGNSHIPNKTGRPVVPTVPAVGWWIAIQGVHVYFRGRRLEYPPASQSNRQKRPGKEANLARSQQQRVHIALRTVALELHK